MHYKGHNRIVVDNIHGDIALTEEEWRIVNTASFQRLRNLKQLGMGHLTYPNATHTRFAHSLGVLKIMSRIVETPGLKLKENEKKDLRIAALLHDIGHYPYSHLMERIDNVKLTEEIIPSKKAKKTTVDAVNTYPDHEELGRHIIATQKDMRKVIGSVSRAREIGHLFSRTKATNQQNSKLIHSSLDMDRLDYLLRDARSSGVPYGEIDLNYILNNVRVSPDGLVGIDYKALAAAEHVLMARAFMHRAVYYHKTTYGFEEACRQLLRRLRDAKVKNMPIDGQAIFDKVSGDELSEFTDSFVDQLIRKAADSKDPVINELSKTILTRKAPRLIAEVSGLEKRKDEYCRSMDFRRDCVSNIEALASSVDLPVGQFFICGPKPIKFEERGGLLSKDDFSKIATSDREELIMVFERGASEPKSIVDIPHTLIAQVAGYAFGIHRLYFVDSSTKSNARLEKLTKMVSTWRSLRPTQGTESGKKS